MQIPRYLFRRAASKDLEKLLHAHLLQLEVEMWLEETGTSTNLNSELQLRNYVESIERQDEI